MDIKLDFINQSDDVNNSQVIISAINTDPGSAEQALAWQVIDDCGPGDNHPFDYPTDMTVAVSDSEGNFTPQQPATLGHGFAFSRTSKGDQLTDAGAIGNPAGVAVENGLEKDPIDAYFYRAGKPFVRMSILAQQMTTFQFETALWIGVASKITEGQILYTNSKLSLSGIASADIVMTGGGGAGISAAPFEFALANVVKI